MNKMGLWLKPVTMTEVALPRLQRRGNSVYTRTEGGLELSRWISEGETLILADENVISIGAGAASNAGSLRSAALPHGVRRVDDYAFFQCENLNEVRLPDTLTTIGDFAFAGCKALKSLYVPESVTSIGQSAFSGTEGLTLCGAENSAIHRYARENGLFFMTASGPSAAA